MGRRPTPSPSGCARPEEAARERRGGARAAAALRPASGERRCEPRGAARWAARPAGHNGEQLSRPRGSSREERGEPARVCGRGRGSSGPTRRCGSGSLRSLVLLSPLDRPHACPRGRVTTARRGRLPSACRLWEQVPGHPQGPFAAAAEPRPRPAVHLLPASLRLASGCGGVSAPAPRPPGRTSEERDQNTLPISRP